MSARYESLSPNGFSTMVTRIFTKIKSITDSKQNTLTAGDFITINNDVISSNQAETITYAAYQQLTTAERNDGTLRCIVDYPSPSPFTYDSTEEAIVISNGAVIYDAQNEAFIL